MHDLLERLQEITESLMHREASIPEAASPREPGIPEPLPQVESGKHNVFTHFPKDRNCEVCRRTNIATAPCRKRTSDHIPLDEKFGGMTADHKVRNQECESRNNDR